MKKKRVVLDPAHGGSDGGEVGYGLVEKDLTLRVAKGIRQALVGFSVDVLLTRNKDIELAEEERVRLANEWGADLFVSIHINSESEKGFVSYVSEKNRFDTTYMQFAFHREMIKRVRLNDEGRKQRSAVCLDGALMPAILTSSYSLQFAKDAKRLKDRRVIDALAAGYGNGILDALDFLRIKGNKPTYLIRVDGVIAGTYKCKSKVMAILDEQVGEAKNIRLEQIEHG
ncbi:N-acetylmuramoyl-L-alanine amidase [Bacillus sp. JCM 19045]|nr:N-acetylmuramoyl-L-alanine amidase [Bacillus sp. JCM 19045]